MSSPPWPSGSCETKANGIATRPVPKLNGSRSTLTTPCPPLPDDPAFTPPEKPPKHPVSVSRPNFIELCTRLTLEDEKAFEHLWRHLGLSVDWTKTYQTIDRQAQRVSQAAFLHLLARGLA